MNALKKMAAERGAYIAVVTLFLGCLLIRELPFGYTECALLYLSAVIAVSACYVGRDR